MTRMNWISLGLLILEIGFGVGLKLYTRWKVRNLDGLGKVRKQGDGRVLEITTTGKKR